MAIFDTIFAKTEKNEKKSSPREYERAFASSASVNQSASASPNSGALPAPVKPRSFQDIYALLESLKLGRTIAVDCSELKEATAIRVLDILSGAIYTLNGSWSTYGNEVFFFVPNSPFAG